MAQTIAQVIADMLIANGIDQLYCLPGVQNDDFFDALYDRQNRLNPVHARHEQGAAYMALGAAMASGKPQAFCVVPGPGFLNATAALATAYSSNAPIFSLVGQIPLGAIGKGYGMLHEIPDQLAILRGLTKEAWRIESGADAGAILQAAFTGLVSGRPRPVGVEVPVNIWRQQIEPSDLSLTVSTPGTPPLDAGKIADAAKLLSNAKRPMIFVGGGAQHASEAVTLLAETIGAPVVAFRNGHGILSAHHPLSTSSPAAHTLWQTCDVVLALGTRLQMPQMQWGMDENLDIIHVDIDEAEVGRITTPKIGLVGDARDAATQITSSLSDAQADRKEWLQHVADTKERFAALYQEKLAPQLAWLAAIRDELPEDGIFVDELTQMGYVSRFAFPVYKPRTFLSTGYQGTLGWGIATALGAAHARRDVPVVAISGDGGALYTISELATAVRHNIPLTIIIFNDNAFGNVRRFQIENYNNRPIASDLTSPDFVKLAESFGVQSRRVTTPEELRASLRQSIKSRAPNVIEVPVGEFASPWGFIMLPKVRGAKPA